MRVVRAVVIGLLVLVGLPGCDKLKSLTSGGEEDATATASSSAAAPGPGTAMRPPVLPTDVVANVNGVVISKADIELRVEELKALVANMGQAWTPLTAEQLEAVMEELVNNELMSQEAVARGLDRQLATQRRFEFLRRTFFAQEWLRWNNQKLDVSSAEVEQYYDTNKLGFRTPERRKLRQLTVASEDEAKQALSQLLSGSAEFSSLAQQISLAPSKSQGGLMADWVVREAEQPLVTAEEASTTTVLDPALEASVFAIDQISGFSSYVKGADNRYHIFQLVEKQAERTRPMTEMWDQIKQFLLFQKLQGSLEDLKGKAKIERFSERLDGVKQE